MKQFLLTMAGVFAGLVIFLVGVPFLLIVIAAGAAQPTALPAQTVLELDLREDLTDQDAQNPLAAFSGGGLSVISVVETLRHAETDDKVVMGVAHKSLPLHGVQFHPESIASEHGHLILKNFLDIAAAWNAAQGRRTSSTNRAPARATA